LSPAFTGSLATDPETPRVDRDDFARREGDLGIRLGREEGAQVRVAVLVAGRDAGHAHAARRRRLPGLDDETAAGIGEAPADCADAKLAHGELDARARRVDAPRPLGQQTGLQDR
jgi:hypothetical protein